MLPVYTDDGISVELRGMSRDLSAVTRAESEAKRSEQRIRTVLQDLPVVIAVASLQADQRIFDRTTTFDRLFGWTPQEIATGRIGSCGPIPTRRIAALCATDTDRHTGVWNRADFEEAVASESARAVRYGAPVSLLLLDLDLFKAINDTHGHFV